MYYILEKRSWHTKMHGPYESLYNALRQKDILLNLNEYKKTYFDIVSETKDRIIMFHGSET